jgi:hypothetical protein
MVRREKLQHGIDDATLVTGLSQHDLSGQCQLIVQTALSRWELGPYA